MSAPSTPYLPSTIQQQGIIKYTINCVESLANVWNLRQQFLMRDLAYYREVDRSITQQRALQANLTGDPTKYQNLIVPVIMPQVESALAYNAGVFLTDYPIFGVASNPQNASSALQMETVIADNSIHYGWVRQLILFMRDCLKYNFGALEVSWDKKKIYSLVTDLTQGSALSTQGRNNEVYYEGNNLKRLDPYNLIWDRRVLNPIEVPEKGEFAGYTEVMGRVALKQFLLNLDTKMTMNAKEAFQSGSPSITLNGSDSWYYIPQINPNSFIGTQTMPTTNWLAWAAQDGQNRPDGIQYNNMYEVTTLYARIIPNDFNLTVPQRNQPQIWKFIVVNRRVLVYVERQTNAHNLLPILVGQAIEDGLGYQTKSFLDNAAPFQYMSSSLWNAAIESKRRLVFDRIFYDPSRIRKEDIDRASSVARIPVKQSAYGKPVTEAVYAFPYRDDGLASTIQMSESVTRMADESNGQNRVDRGQFQKGNKSKAEFVTTMGNSNSRQQLQALGFEYQVFIKLKEMLKLNILQYQPAAELYNISQKAPVKVDPKQLREAALVFKISDGLLSSEKMLNSDLLQVFMQTIQTSPLMQAEYDIVGAFAYWCKLQGAQWFDDFKRTPEQAKQIMDTLAQHAAASKTPGARPQNAETPPATATVQ